MEVSRGMLRLVTAGSVDDGKSTLIGRLLCDTGAVQEDTLESLRSGRTDAFDLAFITDGLKAEREQGITIDVAYRYFRTPRRTIIIADCPGHIEYTRNMVTGASTASLALLLVDARKGLLEQTRRHAAVLGLMGVRQSIAVVNKMDLVGYDAAVFQRIRQAFLDLARRCGIATADAIPVSALLGDNVTSRSARLGWFEGPTLLEFLESAPTAIADAAGPLRFPVQWVIRNGDAFRGYAGSVTSGTAVPGMDVVVLPGGRETRIRSIHAFEGERETAAVPAAVVLSLEHDIECGRGSVIAEAARRPELQTRVECDLVWMSDQPLESGRPYLLKHATQTVCAELDSLHWRLDFDSLVQRPAERLELNDIGRATIEMHRPLPMDLYSENRAAGSFILIDPRTNSTAGAGMVRAAEAAPGDSAGATALGRRGLVLWFTGLSSAGKTTLSEAVYERLWATGCRVEHLDGDVLRQHLCRDLGFSRADRIENIRRIAFVAQTLSRHGVLVLVSAISPYREMREDARRHIGPGFVEIYVNARLDVCMERDVKGLYRKSRAGEIHGLTGIDDPYEPPLSPELECRTDAETVAESVQKVMTFLERFLNER